VIIHLTFSTKNRRRLIPPELQQELSAYITGILKNLDCPSIRTNAVEDHAHSLFLLSKIQALAHVIEEMKRGTSKWIKTKGPQYAYFSWQVGYAAFSVGQVGLDKLIEYIENQQKHHEHISFQDEVRQFFKRYGLELDEGTFWD